VRHKETTTDNTASFSDVPAPVETTLAIKSGAIIACYLQKYEQEEPQLGIVTNTPGNNSEEVEVEWMVGAYHEPWKLWKQRRGETWKERVPISAVLFPVVLSGSSRIPAATIDKLKFAYQQLRSEH